MNIIITLVFFIAFAALFVYLTILSAKQAELKLRNLLSTIGFTKSLDPVEKENVLRALSIVNSRHQGKRLLMHFYKKAAFEKDTDIYMCDYSFSSASGKARGSRGLYVCIISQNFNLPRFTLESAPEGPTIFLKLFEMLSNTMPFPDLKRIDPSLLDLQQHCYVYAPSNASNGVIQIKDSIVTTFKNKSGIGVDAKGTTLVLSDIETRSNQVSKKPLNTEKIKSLVSLGLDFKKNLEK